jgi:3-phenylpropionate/trans-cinnamate dioxygenase ferredoxin reductase component
MPLKTYPYVIVGGGLAGASAVEGIRELDRKGAVLLIGNERHPPYHRPPLSKKLWTGQKKVEEIMVHAGGFYEEQAVTLVLGSTVTSVDTAQKTITDDKGGRYQYGKLLLATGGTPRKLSVPGGDVAGISYYRYLDDYLKLREDAEEGKSAVVIGGGFIGSEIAAALTENRITVTMVFPELFICNRVFPESLAGAIQRRFIERGIRIVSGDKPASFSQSGDRFVTTTGNGERIESDIVVVGIGISPSVGLAESAGIETANGIIVNEYLQTSHPDVYAAGDNALFPSQALGQRLRLEHWDNALAQGKQAGRNMAGARDPFAYLPYFFSDLFEFGYEAVGEVNAALETFADWQKENDTGVIYYLKDGKVRGAMMCNVWDKVDAARELIRKNEPVSPEVLRGAIR